MTTPHIRVRTRPEPQPHSPKAVDPEAALPAVPQWLDEQPDGAIVVPEAPKSKARTRKSKRPKKERVLGNYDVGFCRPPQTTKWREGFCPNPKGRPKGSKTVDAHIEDALNERIPVQEGGRRKKVTKAEAIAKQLVNDAIKGSAKARDQILRRTAAAAGKSTGSGPVLDEALHAEIDWEILNHFAREIGGRYRIEGR